MAARGPLLQLAGYVILIVLIAAGQVSWWYAAALVVMALVGLLQTAGAALVEDIGYHRYRSRDLVRLAGWALLEVLWYQPLTAVWRCWATVLVVTGRRPGRGSIPRRKVLRDEQEPELLPAPLPALAGPSPK